MRILLPLFLISASIANAQVRDAQLYRQAMLSENPAVVLKRSLSHTLRVEMINQISDALSKTLGAVPDRGLLLALVTSYNRAWDAKGRLVDGAIPLLANRLASVPLDTVRDWASLSGSDLPTAAFTLAALAGIWNSERFDDRRYHRMVISIRTQGVIR